MGDAQQHMESKLTQIKDTGKRTCAIDATRHLDTGFPDNSVIVRELVLLRGSSSDIRVETPTDFVENRRRQTEKTPVLDNGGLLPASGPQPGMLPLIWIT